jgi:sugar lactone lactonase YvrE
MKRLPLSGDFFEGARWHDSAWWVSDMYGQTVWRIAPDGTGTLMAEMNARPSGLGWLPDGDLLIASVQERRLVRRHGDGSFSTHADVAPYSEFWINDMLVDRLGRAYVGNIGFDPLTGGKIVPTTLCRIDPDGRGAVVATNMLFPNGTVLTRDGKTLIVGESLGNRMTAFTIDVDGGLGNRRVWAQFGPTPTDLTFEAMHRLELAPDGCAIDREDCVWVADAANRRVCRVAEGGRILSELRTPDHDGIYACALGGPNGRTLLICAAPSSAPQDCEGKRTGALFVHEVDIPAP